MELFSNKAESFFREIRSIEIYDANTVSYIDNFNGVFPNPSDALYIFKEIVPESFNQKVATKTQNGNYFTDLDINFPLLDMSEDNINKCQQYFNKKKFALVFNSNVEKIMFGNKKEKVKVEFLDGKKNDNSGNDECTLAISGDSIIPVKIKNLL